MSYHKVFQHRLLLPQDHVAPGFTTRRSVNPALSAEKERQIERPLVSRPWDLPLSFCPPRVPVLSRLSSLFNTFHWEDLPGLGKHTLVMLAEFSVNDLVSY